MISDSLPWQVAPGNLQLSLNEVHVWRASLDVSASEVYHFRHLLSDEEEARAKRLYFEKDRQRWIVARGLLRTLLSRYLQVDPRQLQFSFNSYGKPFLAMPFSENGLQFNISHSANLALYAFTYGIVGIDVEFMRENIEYEQIAQYHFSAHECDTLLSLPTELRQQAFFLCWTRKEAYIKARGQGLSLPLDQFDVSLKPGDPAALLASYEDPQEVQRWTFQDLLPGPDFAGALVVEKKTRTFSYWQAI